MRDAGGAVGLEIGGGTAGGGGGAATFGTGGGGQYEEEGAGAGGAGCAERYASKRFLSGSAVAFGAKSRARAIWRHSRCWLTLSKPYERDDKRGGRARGGSRKGRRGEERNERETGCAQD